MISPGAPHHGNIGGMSDPGPSAPPPKPVVPPRELIAPASPPKAKKHKKKVSRERPRGRGRR